MRAEAKVIRSPQPVRFAFISIVPVLFIYVLKKITGTKLETSPTKGKEEGGSETEKEKKKKKKNKPPTEEGKREKKSKKKEKKEKRSKRKNSGWSSTASSRASMPFIFLPFLIL